MISSRLVQDVTVPAVQILLQAVVYLTNFTSTGVNIRDRDDPMALLTMGCVVENTAVTEDRGYVQLACERQYFKAWQLRSLQISCKQGDDARDGPFCFTNAAEVTKLTRKTFFKMERVRHCEAYERPQAWEILESHVVCLRMSDMTLTTGTVSGLVGCTHSKQLDMIIGCEGKQSLGNMSLSRFRKLGTRRTYNTVSMLSSDLIRVRRTTRLQEV